MAGRLRLGLLAGLLAVFVTVPAPGLAQGQGAGLSLNNASALTVTKGALVSVAGGSLFKLTGGSLIVKDALSTVTFNGAPIDAMISGIPVHLTNGAVAGQVSVAPGFTPFVGGSPVGTGAVLIVDGATSKMVLGP